VSRMQNADKFCTARAHFRYGDCLALHDEKHFRKHALLKF
jgi:hypothetical protein